MSSRYPSPIVSLIRPPTATAGVGLQICCGDTLIEETGKALAAGRITAAVALMDIAWSAGVPIRAPDRQQAAHP
jgi:hypothetical protein